MADAVEPRTSGSARFRGQRFLLALSLLLLVVAWLFVRPYLAPVMLALIIGYATFPIYTWILARVRYRRLAASLMLVLTALAIVIPFSIITALLVDQAATLAENAQSEAAIRVRLQNALVDLGLPEGMVRDFMPELTSQVANTLQAALVPTLTAITEIILAVIVFFVLLFFVYTDGPGLVRYVRHVLPLDATRKDRLIRRTAERTRAILYGTVLVSIVQGVFTALGWWFFGYPAPVFWGFVMTVLALIPFAGPFFIVIPAGLFGIIQGDYFSGIGLLVWGIGLGGIIDDVVRPYFIGRQSGVHPAVILIGILGGVSVFGVIGFIVGPLLLSFVAPVLDAWVHPEDEPLRGEDDAEPAGEARREHHG